MQKAVHPEHDVVAEPAEHDSWPDLRQHLSTHGVNAKQGVYPKGPGILTAHRRHTH